MRDMPEVYKKLKCKSKRTYFEGVLNIIIAINDLQQREFYIMEILNYIKPPYMEVIESMKRPDYKLTKSDIHKV